MAYIMTDPVIGAQAFADVSTTAKHNLLEKRRGTDSTSGGGDFVYVQASMAIVQYDAVVIKANGKIIKTMETAYKSGVPAFAQIAFANDDYGWVLLNGKPLVRLTSGTDQNVPLYVNASDGVLSGATTSCVIRGLVAQTSVTTTVNAVTCIAQFPSFSWGASLSQI